MSKSLLEKGRAAYAYKQVSVYFNSKPEKQQKEYRSYLKKLPAMIQMNGLGQTFAFYSSQGGTYQDIYNQISLWLGERYEESFFDKGAVEAIISMNSGDYRMMTVEVMALSNWMRRFADGLIRKG